MRARLLRLLPTLFLIMAVVSCSPTSPVPETATRTDDASSTVSPDDTKPTHTLPPTAPAEADHDNEEPSSELTPVAATAYPIEEESMPTNVPQSSPSDPAQQQLIEQAKEDLANRLNVANEEIDLSFFEQVIWPDGSLGCPQPGMVYTQVQRDGYRIRLQVGKRTFDYHGGGGRAPFLCENTKSDTSTPLPPPGFGDD